MRIYMAGFRTGKLCCGVGAILELLGLVTFAQAADRRLPPPVPLVVVIDSGIDREHPIFSGRFLANEVVQASLPEPLGFGPGKTWSGWDFVDGDADPQDRTGHGTHVAGLVAEALGPPGDSLVRVAMFRTGDQQHELAPVAAALEAVVSMIEMGWDVPVVVCAFDYRRTPEDGAAFERFSKAFRKVLDSGVLCVCAAGNGGRDLDHSPEDMAQYQVAFSHPALIAVAACTDEGQLLAASNYGGKSVALAAPGFAAPSAARDGGSIAMSGSSQAAARVAGRLVQYAAVTKERDVARLRTWLLKAVHLNPSLVGRVASAGFLPLAQPVAK
jgi:subtilisin family serine protease